MKSDAGIEILSVSAEIQEAGHNQPAPAELNERTITTNFTNKIDFARFLYRARCRSSYLRVLRSDASTLDEGFVQKLRSGSWIARSEGHAGRFLEIQSAIDVQGLSKYEALLLKSRPHCGSSVRATPTLTIGTLS
jgi:hypothetical protein